MEGWYYLHTNGDLIYKRELGETAADIRESDFARALWPLTIADRASAWRIVIEALAAGAKKERVMELAGKWGCDNEDAMVYAGYAGARVFLDGDSYCATRKDFTNLQECEAGFGDTALEALSDLCLKLGYRPSKMWGNDFAGLLKCKAADTSTEEPVEIQEEEQRKP